MSKKWIKVMITALSVFVIGSIAFVGSSKGPGIPPSNANECDNIDDFNNWENVELTIVIPQTGFDQFRTSGNEYYIPTNDFRYFTPPPVGGGSNDGASLNYYLYVTVTETECDGVEWKRAMAPDNYNGNGKMRIKVPPKGVGFEIKAKYYEVSEAVNFANQNFNKPQSEMSTKHKLVYTYTESFFSIPGNAWTAWFTPSHLQQPTVLWNGNKGLVLTDYDGVNDFIDSNN